MMGRKAIYTPEQRILRARESNRRAYQRRKENPDAPRAARAKPRWVRRFIHTPESRKAALVASTRRWQAKNRTYLRQYRNSPEQRAKDAAYRALPENKRKAAKATARWRESAANRAKKAAYMVQYHAKVKADPVRYAKVVAMRVQYGREKWRAIRADPARHAAYNANMRKNQQRRAEQKRLRTNPQHADSMRANLMRMIPRSLHDDLRAEVCNDLLADIWAGVIALDQVPGVLKSYMTAARKTMHSDYEFDSLDDVLPGTDSLKRGDTIASDRRIYDATPFKH